MSAWEGLTPRRCAIHVHSDYYDGDEPMESIVAHARAAGVDVLLLTDHHEAFAARDGWEGWHDGVLVVVGVEFSTRGSHLLGFGIHEKVGTRRLSGPEAATLLERLDATVFVAHPQGRRSVLTFRIVDDWTHWDQPVFAGIELWSYMHDWIEEFRPWRLPAMCRDPEAYITGPPEEMLRRWELAVQHRPVAALGGLDTHGRRLPFGTWRLFPWAREGILPYRTLFAAFSTYALCAPFGAEERFHPRLVLDALARGQSWICRDSLAPGRDFRFAADYGGPPLPPGSEIPYADGIRLRVDSPVRARLRLISRGQVLAEKEDLSLDYAVTEPGEYRVQASLGDSLWILTNHIYIRDPQFL